MRMYIYMHVFNCNIDDWLNTQFIIAPCWLPAMGFYRWVHCIAILSMQQLTLCTVSQLSAHNFSIRGWPSIIRYSSPSPFKTHFHSVPHSPTDLQPVWYLHFDSHLICVKTSIIIISMQETAIVFILFPHWVDIEHQHRNKKHVEMYINSEIGLSQTQNTAHPSSMKIHLHY